jgi:hypothetical protein
MAAMNIHLCLSTAMTFSPVCPWKHRSFICQPMWLSAFIACQRSGQPLIVIFKYMLGYIGDAPLRKPINLALIISHLHHPTGFMTVNPPGLPTDLPAGSWPLKISFTIGKHRSLRCQWGRLTLWKKGEPSGWFPGVNDILLFFSHDGPTSRASRSLP